MCGVARYQIGVQCSLVCSGVCWVMCSMNSWNVIGFCGVLGWLGSDQAGQLGLLWVYLFR